MGMEKKSVAIIGAGVSGLVACKHLLERGYRPVVFEADTALGGVWANTPDCTRLQTPRPMYQYSDFPWPDSITEEYPASHQVSSYLDAYARHFGVLDCVRLGHRVAGMEYAGVPEEELYKADFVILCTGRASGVPNVPTFPLGKGPEAFDGKVIHSTDYSKMGSDKAKEMIKGKLVTLVGYGNSALDISNECAQVNGAHKPCTMIFRTKRCVIPDFSPWGVNISYFYLTRFAELLIHKPGEGLLLSMLATILTPMRLVFSKFAESYYYGKLNKHDMMPRNSFFAGVASCLVAIAPKTHFKNLEEGNIVLHKSNTLSFCKEGVILEGKFNLVKSDIVIFATGFKGDQNIKDMFTSKYFRSIVVDSESTTVPLYRQCIHPKIPQLAVIGYSESYANLYTSELQAKWLTHFMDGGFKLPSVKAMQRDVLEWEKFMKLYSPSDFRASCIGILQIWYNDQLCKDMGCNPRKKNNVFAELFDTYGPSDYINLHPK
ncbi:hypothetical protein ACQ4PT_061774 [Festuca glaucescens]